MVSMSIPKLKKVFVGILQNNTVLISLSGFLLGLSHLHENVWFLSLFGLVPFLYVVNSKNFQQQSVGKIFLNGWLFGLIFIGIAIVWFWGAYPLNWILDSKQTAVFVVFVVWMVTVAALSVIFGYLTIFASWCARFNLWQLLVIPAVWVLSEYLRMWLFAILTIAEPSLFGPHFSFGFLGYTLASNNFLLQFADFGGVYTLSFIAVFINVAIYLLFKKTKQKKKRNSFGIGIFCVFLMVAHLASEQIFTAIEKRSESSEIKVALLNTYFLRKGEEGALGVREKYEVYKNLLQENQSRISDVDIIVFPESANFIEKALVSGQLENLGLATTTIVVDSKVRFSSEGKDRSTESVYYYTKEGGMDFVYDKQFLTPVGEYNPNILDKFLSLVEENNEKPPRFLYQKGPIAKPIVRDDRIRTVSLLCSEIASPYFYKNAVKENEVDLLINLSSHAYTGRSPILFSQVINMAKVHAVQNRKPFIQATNAAPSFVVNKYGILVAESARGEESMLISYIKIGI